MKYIVNLFRVLVGLLFIFSGLIKANDPTGFSYKLDEYFSVFSADLETPQDSFNLEVLVNDSLVQTLTQSIDPSSTTNLLLLENDSWIPKPVPGTDDTVFFGGVSVVLNGRILFSEDLQAQKSDSTFYQIAVNATIGDSPLASQANTITAGQKYAKTIDIDLGQHEKYQSWLVDFFQGLRPYVLGLAIFLCVLEIVLGLALLIGWAPKFTITLLVIIIVLFTFLTWYSAYYNKVTDCGCFGDAIKLTPWQSFNKDVILSISILIILLGIRHIKPIFSKPFAVKLLTVFILLSAGFSAYCWHYLPVKDFLKFKEGNNIKDLAVVPEDAPTDEYENTFIYSKDGIDEELSLEEMSGRNLADEGYTFVDRRDKLISKGFDPEIHDFKIMDDTRSNDYVDDFFADSSHKLLIVFNEIDQADLGAMSELKALIAACKKQKIAIYPLTASASDKVEAFRHEHQLDIPFYFGDKTNLKSIIRSNPGVVLFEGNVVKETWPSTRLPSVKRFLKKVTK